MPSTSLQQASITSVRAFSSHSGFWALVIILIAPFASAAEAAWPEDSASELSVFLTMLRFRIYADHCSAQVPKLKPEFNSLLENLDSRIQGISKSLLAFDVFRDMSNKPVPTDIVNAFRDSFDDMKHNVERRDAASLCAEKLQTFKELDDDSLKSGLTGILTAVQKMSRNLEADSAL